MEERLYKRSIVDEIEHYLFTRDVIVLHGARQVGKTHILYYLQRILKKKRKQTHYIDLEDSRNVQILNQGVDAFLAHLAEEGFKKKEQLFVFIDEIQYLENPSSFLKLLADHHPELKLIVSGSSSFDIKSKFKNSLVGRTVNFNIFNLSFREFLAFKNISWPGGKSFTLKKIEELKMLYREYTLYGGYPKIVLTPDATMKEKYLQQIIDTYIRKDIRDLAAIKDIGKFNRLLELLASQSGQLLNVTEIANTCALAKQTVEHYLFLLEQTFIIRLLRPFSTNLRSELSKTPKVFFYDTGLMQMLWLKEIPKEVLGQVFETSIFAELVKQYGTEKIFYWRTKDKKEIDFVLRDKQQLLPIEVKLNFAQFQMGALKAFHEDYQNKTHRLVALVGTPEKKGAIHPWEL